MVVIMYNLTKCLKQSMITIASMLILTCFIPFKVHASTITLSPTTYTFIENANMNSLVSQFLNNDVFPYLPSQITDLLDSLDIPNSNVVTSDKFVIRPLTSSEINDLQSNGNYTEFYDQNGYSFELSELYFVTYDNGYVHGSFYTNDDGDLLYLTPDGTNTLYNVGIGGSLINSNTWNSIFAELSDQIKENNFAFNPDDLEITPQTYFYWYGNYANYRPTSAHYYFCTNEYNPGVIMRMPNENGKTVFYTNDPDSLIYQCTLGNAQNQKTITSGDYYHNSIHYSYKITLPFDGNFTVNNTYESWINTVGNGVYNRNFANNGTTYNSTLAINAHSATMFKPITLSGTDSLPIPTNEDVSADDLQDIIDGVITDYVRNPSFDGRNSLSDTNYPFTYPLSSSIGASSLPLPDTVVQEYSPSLSYPLEIQPTIDIAIDSFQNMQIPFISNLQNHYPFSIPWDIAKFISRFSSEPTPPAWNFDWNITVGSTTYTKHFEGDLSDFNSLAEIFRNLVLISFVIALCKFSYDHHF